MVSRKVRKFLKKIACETSNRRYTGWRVDTIRTLFEAIPNALARWQEAAMEQGGEERDRTSPWTFAPIGKEVEWGKRRGRVVARWMWFVVVEFAGGEIERVPLNRVFEVELVEKG